MTKHLLKQGHRRIGILMDKIETSNERLNGYKKALKEYKIDFQKEFSCIWKI
ncbi:MAG: substrate-binding domain-containing protein [Halanaerobiales bacterium]|nr:substrate-binding domain-containing protein [Halanaerobiales bacterium]